MIATNENPTFNASSIRPWNGRYGKTAGGCGWRVKSSSGEWKALIKWTTDDMTVECHAVDCEATSDLAAAVARGKQHMGDSGGGSFVINEYGQVIVPSSKGDGSRVIVGEINGGVLIDNPLADTQIDKFYRLWETDDLAPSDQWEKPYVGAQYNLNKWSKIYYYRTSDDGGGSEFPLAQDEGLVSALRNIRRTGPVRFVVNPYGIVLTKRPEGDDWSQNENWESVFVGKINYEKWFKKES